MTAHEWYVENRAGFATRTLDERDARAFGNHLSRCEECRRAVSEIERDLAWLPMQVAPVPPRPGLTREILEGVLHPRRAARWPWVAAVAAAAAVTLGAGAWTVVRHQMHALQTAVDAGQGRLHAIQDSLSAIVGAERVLQETISGPGYKGGMLIFYDADTQRWNVVVHDLPPAPIGQAYQLWFLSSRGLLAGPELQVNGSRPTFLALPAPRPPDNVVGAVLTLGSPNGPSGVAARVELARLTF